METREISENEEIHEDLFVSDNRYNGVQSRYRDCFTENEKKKKELEQKIPKEREGSKFCLFLKKICRAWDKKPSYKDESSSRNRYELTEDNA